jgi:hypothetical protein
MFGIGELTKLVRQLRIEMTAGFGRLERLEKLLMAQIDELNTKLDAVAAAETKLGTDIDTVVEFLKNNVPPTPDLTAQLAKLDTIAQALIDSDNKTLANLPPVPPASRR